FERLLQMRRVVDLKDQLPRRRRQDWSVNRKSKLTTQGRCNVVANVQTVIRLQLLEVLTQIRRNCFQHAEQIVNQRYRVLHDKSSDDVRVRRDVFERTHRSRSCEPRRNATLSIVERQRSLRVRLSVKVFLIENEILHAQNAQTVQRGFLLLSFRT